MIAIHSETKFKTKTATTREKNNKARHIIINQSIPLFSAWSINPISIDIIYFSFINLCIIHVESIRTRRKELFLIRNKKKKGMIANKKAQYSTSMHFE